MSISLDDLRASNGSTVIDTTKGKVTKPPIVVPKEEEIDPIFAPTTRVTNTPRTAVVDDLDSIPKAITEVEDDDEPTVMPKIDVIEARMTDDPEQIQEFDISSLPKRPEELGEGDIELMDQLEAAVEREKESISERIDAIVEMQHKEMLEAMEKENEIREAEDHENGTSFEEEDMDSYEDTDASDDSFMDIGAIDDDLNAEANGELVDELDEATRNKMIDNLRDEVKRNIIPIKNKIDLNAFKVADTPMAASKAVSFNLADLNRADWVLPVSKTTISVSGLSGPEIFALNPQNENPSRSKINAFKDMYGIIYKHILGTKPSFEDWLKTTNFSEIQHIYFALYKATFSGSNFLYYECPKCHDISIQDKSFEDMIKYGDDATKELVDGIMNGEVEPNEHAVSRYQVSDKYVVDIAEPTIWNIISYSSLSNNFLSKYEDLIDVLSFIERIYVIDQEKMQLVPIDTSPDKNSIVRTISRQISTFASVIKTLPSDNFIELRSYISSNYLANTAAAISYQVPEHTCEKCNHKFEATEMEASTLLFMRHQLGALGAI